MRYYKPYNELTFTDDFMFRKVLMNNQDLCKRLVELLLDMKIGHIEYKDDEHKIETSSDRKSVRLDVYLEDENGTVFDLEMQNQHAIDIAKRSRFYQSMIDIEHLEAGSSYDELPDSYIVFICTFDPFGEEMAKYEFREMCKDRSSMELGSGTSKIFINARSKSKEVSDEMRAFLAYLCGESANSRLTRDIESNILQAKERGIWRREYMTLEDSLKVERKIWQREARAEGETAARMEDVDRLAAEGTFTAEKACEVLGVPLKDYEEHLKTIQ